MYAIEKEYKRREKHDLFWFHLVLFAPWLKKRPSRRPSVSELEQTCLILMRVKLGGGERLTAASCWPPVIFLPRNNLHWEDRVDVKGQGAARDSSLVMRCENCKRILMQLE